jgi:uncharacterized membrane protein YphA (DoxX/SURF4 family)
MHRQIKAILFIAALAGAEVHQGQQGAHFGVRFASGANKQTERKVAEPKFQEANQIVKQMSALLSEPSILAQAKRVAEQMESLTSVSDAREEVKAFAQRTPASSEMEAQEQAKLVAQSWAEKLQADPKFQEQADFVEEQIKAIFADPNFQEQGKRVKEQLEAMLQDQNLQEWAERMQDTTAGLAGVEGMEEGAKLVAEQMQEIFQDPTDAEVMSQDKMADGMMDTMVDSMVARTLPTSSLDQGDLETAMLGKSSSPTGRRLQAAMLGNRMGVRSSLRSPLMNPASFTGASARTSSVARAFTFPGSKKAEAPAKGKKAPVPEPDDKGLPILGIEIDEDFQENVNELAYLLTRLAAASVMIHHGQEKIASAEAFTKFAIDTYFSFLPQPHIFWTYSAGYVQLLAPFFMVTGIFSRVAAASLAGTMLGAFYYSIASTGYEGYPLSKMAGRVPVFHNYGFETPALYFAIFVLVAATGPGKFSIAQALGWNEDKSLLGKLKQ